MVIQQRLIISTPGRGLKHITSTIADIVQSAKIKTGLCNVFLHHTSASLIIGENADSTVLADLEHFMQRLAPDGDLAYSHTAEGPDDMPSHIRAVLTTNSISIPVTDKKLALGTWQGIFIWEHRFKAYERQLTVTIQGE